MATSTKIVLISVLVFLLLSCRSDAYSLKACKIDKLYQFGDSMLDTGNVIHELTNTRFSYLPYGQTLSNPTGRCSDGLLIIDYFALDAGLPWLNPYLDKNASTNQGVNFAVAGAPALPLDVLAQKNITGFITNTSLDRQVDWMSSHFNSICHNPRECHDTLRNALFIVGEIGGNDYNYGLLRGKTLQEVKALTPDVAQAIKRAVQRIISYGATRILIPGNFPIGCFPFYLAVFPSNDTNAYDGFHCRKDFNDLSIYHNKYIKKIIKVLRKENPRTMIVYGDIYNAYLWILHHASQLGFDDLQKACCGKGGIYNYDLQNTCGPGVPVCPNPSDHISWDGVHLTQKAYKFVAYWLINNIYPKLKCIV